MQLLAAKIITRWKPTAHKPLMTDRVLSQFWDKTFWTLPPFLLLSLSLS